MLRTFIVAVQVETPHEPFTVSDMATWVMCSDIAHPGPHAESYIVDCTVFTNVEDMLKDQAEGKLEVWIPLKGAK